MPDICLRSSSNRSCGLDWDGEQREDGARKKTIERLAAKSATDVEKSGMRGKLWGSELRVGQWRTVINVYCELLGKLGTCLRHELSTRFYLLLAERCRNVAI
jgi:hypothetical protein